MLESDQAAVFSAVEAGGWRCFDIEGIVLEAW